MLKLEHGSSQCWGQTQLQSVKQPDDLLNLLQSGSNTDIKFIQLGSYWALD